VIDIELWKFLTVLGTAAVLMLGAGLVLGRWGLPSRRVVEERYGIEVTDVEGYDDGDMDAALPAAREDLPVPAAYEAAGLAQGASLVPAGAGSARSVTQVFAPLTPYADWREQTAAELAPAHLDELAERIDLPGPLSGAEQPEAGRGANPQPFAGPGSLIRDWPTDTRLPAILTLGQAGDGSDKTFARASLAQWDFMVRFRDERDELDRMLAAGRAA
jgi:hypothetical protein